MESILYTQGVDSLVGTHVLEGHVLLDISIKHKHVTPIQYRVPLCAKQCVELHTCITQYKPNPL